MDHTSQSEVSRRTKLRLREEMPGISLDQLNSAFGEMLEKGSDPYSTPADGHDILLLGDEKLHPRDQAPGDVVTPQAIVESMLFVGNISGEPLTSEQIATQMRGVRAAEVDQFIQELNAEYQSNCCPYTILSSAAGYQMTIRTEFESIRDRCFQVDRRARLSPAAIDVLSIVAYNQPIATAEVDGLRGKSSSSLLRQLVHRQLIALERSTAPSHVIEYRTTDFFLKLFGLTNLAELPRRDEIDRS